MNELAEQPAPTFFGFMPRRVAKRPNWLSCKDVEEICSVSTCVSEAPEGWIDHWLHNGAGFFNSEVVAWQVVPEQQKNEFELFAYRLWPMLFDDGRMKQFDPQADFAELPGELPQREPSLEGYSMIGFDLANRSVSPFVECSPLSCNAMCAEYKVNRWCLLDSVEDAMQAGQDFSNINAGVEPGTYYLFEVLRALGD
ncbi:MAG: hypothetical protein WD534_04155 [Phycisphaeraceae bacterium]